MACCRRYEVTCKWENKINKLESLVEGKERIVLHEMFVCLEKEQREIDM